MSCAHIWIDGMPWLSATAPHIRNWIPHIIGITQLLSMISMRLPLCRFSLSTILVNRTASTVGTDIAYPVLEGRDTHTHTSSHTGTVHNSRLDRDAAISMHTQCTTHIPYPYPLCHS